MNWIAVFIGGGLGSVCRFGISEFGKYMNWELPWATFLSNMLACGILALLTLQFSSKVSEHSVWMAFLLAGFCGGFSTFSTFSFETVSLLRSGEWAWALGNITLSTVTGVVLIWLIVGSE